MKRHGQAEIIVTDNLRSLAFAMWNNESTHGTGPQPRFWFGGPRGCLPDIGVLSSL
jgi:hypothetical protein